MKARAMTQEFIDDFLGYFMDPTNKYMSSLLLKCGFAGWYDGFHDGRLERSTFWYQYDIKE